MILDTIQAQEPEISTPAPASLFGSSTRLDLLRTAAHILVIDDEEFNLQLIRRMLRHAGYSNVTTLNDARGLERQMATAPA